MSNFITFSIDNIQNTVTVTSVFSSSKQNLWNAFTTAKELEKWWAPKPYIAVTKEMTFKVNGRWLYHMLSPKGEKHWCIAEYSEIEPTDYFVYRDAFCDEDGNLNKDFGRMTWKNTFSEKNGTATVTNFISFDSSNDLKKIMEMGFEEGYKMGLRQLKELLES